MAHERKLQFVTSTDDSGSDNEKRLNSIRMILLTVACAENAINPSFTILYSQNDIGDDVGRIAYISIVASDLITCRTSELKIAVEGRGSTSIYGRDEFVGRGAVLSL